MSVLCAIVGPGSFKNAASGSFKNAASKVWVHLSANQLASEPTPVRVCPRLQQQLGAKTGRAGRMQLAETGLCTLCVTRHGAHYSSPTLSHAHPGQPSTHGCCCCLMIISSNGHAATSTPAACLKELVLVAAPVVVGQSTSISALVERQQTQGEGGRHDLFSCHATAFENKLSHRTGHGGTEA